MEWVMGNYGELQDLVRLNAKKDFIIANMSK